MNSSDSETAFLSILLKNPDKIFSISDINLDMFSSNPNKALVTAMLEFGKSNTTPEYNLLLVTLHANGKINECPEDYIKYLFNLDYDVNNFEEFLSILSKIYKQRELKKLSVKLNEDLDLSTIDDSIENIITRLENLNMLNYAEDTSTISSVSNVTWDDLNKRLQMGGKVQTTCGFKQIDNISAGLWPGDVWIVAGRPGTGKSSWLVNSALTTAKAGIPTLIFSYEMPKQSLVLRMVSIETGIPIMDMRLGTLKPKQLEIIKAKLDEFKTLPIFIDSNFFGDINYIKSTIRKFYKLFGVRIIHLDYIQLLVERDENSTQEIGRVSRQLKLLSNQLEVSTILYSQLNRNLESRQDKRPILSDLRQSGNLEEDANLVLCLYRDELYDALSKDRGILENLIRKNREGPGGVLFSMFDGATNKITEGR